MAILMRIIKKVAGRIVILGMLLQLPGGIFPITLHAAAPSQNLSYQGVLTDSGGSPVTTSTSFTFRIYDALTGGNLKHTQNATITPVNGYFSIELTTSASSLSFNESYWMEIVAGGETLTPRQPLLSSPYAAVTHGFVGATTDPTGIFEGQFYFKTDSNSLRYYDGSAWQAYSSGATSLTGLSDVNTATATAGNILVFDGTDAESVAVSGDIALAASGATTIQDNSVDGTDIALGLDATGDLMYYNGTDWARLATGTSGQLLQTNGAAAPSWVTKTTVDAGSTNNTTLRWNGTAWVESSALTNDGADVVATGDVSVQGNTTLGNASGDTVTANAASWTFTNDTAVTLSGGVNGLNFDANTLSIDATNDRIGIGTSTPNERLALFGGFKQTPINPTVSGGVKDATNLDGAYNIYTSGKYAYVANWNDNSLRIIDISNPTSPSVIGGVKDNTNLSNAIGVDVSGKYAYVTAFSNDSLRIIDISNPTSPTMVGGISDSNLDGAALVRVVGKYAYVTAYNNHSLRIIDVSDPTSPTIVGGVKDDTNLQNPEGLYVQGNYAYVANNTDDSLRIIDIFNPASPSIVGGIKNATTLDGANSVYVSGRYAYVAANADDSLRIIDISNPSAPSIVGGIKDATNLDGIYGVYVSGKYAYVAVNNDDSLRVIDVSDPTSPSIVAGVKDATNLDGAIGLHVSGKYAYVTNNTDDSLRIIDISGIDAPSATIGNLAVGTFDVWENADIAGALSVGAGLNVEGSAYFANGVGIDAHVLTAATALSIEGLDALTTGSALSINSDSADTSTRTLTSIVNDNTAAAGTTGLSIQQDSTGLLALFDKNASSTTAGTSTGFHLDYDDTGVVSSGTDTTVGFDLDLNRTGATGGTITSTGLDLDLFGDTGGTSTLTGLDIHVNGADTNYAALFTGGNVGIGTVMPSTTLMVAGTAKVVTANVGLSTGNAAVTKLNDDTILTYSTTGSSTFVPPTGVTSVRVLVVAGGGGGGAGIGGGGGAGGMRHVTSYTVIPGNSYMVTVGTGGAGGTSLGGGVFNAGSQGGNSVFDSITSTGGGGGGSNLGDSGNGGSGGGGSGASNVVSRCNGGTGTSGQGNSGGSNTDCNNTVGFTTAGGGGAGAAAANVTNAGNPSAGGVGLANDISGASTFYAGGGGAGHWGSNHSAGGNGGGGAGGETPTAGTDGLGGGGGGSGNNTGAGADGGDGVVIVRFTNATSTAFDVTTNGNVGIGQTTPITTLDVDGSTRIEGTGTSVITGSIDPTASASVTGVGTAFTTELIVGDRITLSGETRTVTAIASDTSLTVDMAFSDNANDTSVDKLHATLVLKDSAGNVDLVLSDRGYLGVGTGAPTYLFQVNGTATGSQNGGLNSGNATVSTTGEDTVLSYTTTGSSTFTPPAGVTNVRVLVIGGGGGGATNTGGGGGGGGYVYNAAYTVVPGQEYTVTVGDGGTGGAGGGANNGSQGGNSVFATITAYGGGGGGYNGQTGPAGAGLDQMGSGGGGGGDNGTGADPTAGQGNNGGDGAGAPNYGAGGGGGADANGSDGTTTTGGNGGAGTTNNISGSDVAYAAGGGGGIHGKTSDNGTGGSSCGGNGGRQGTAAQQTGTDGTDGRGCGGGGNGNNHVADAAGDGGDGVVIVRFTTQASGTQRGLFVNSTGYTGIGEIENPHRTLHVRATNDEAPVRFQDINGYCEINPTSTSWTCTSDRNLKTNIMTLDSTFERIMSLNPVNFDWKNKVETQEGKRGEYTGLLAQELEEVFPELVTTDEETGLKSVSYGGLTSPLLKSVQEIGSVADENTLLMDENGNKTFAGRFFDRFVKLFANTTNGIGDFFAKRTFTEEICVKKYNGAHYCITGDELEAAVSGGVHVTSVTTPEKTETENTQEKTETNTSKETPNNNSDTNNNETTKTTQGTLTIVSEELGFLRIRATANTESEEVGQIPHGTKVDYFTKENDWYEIKYNNLKGWISGDYVTLDDKMNSTGNTDNTETDTTGGGDNESQPDKSTASESDNTDTEKTEDQNTNTGTSDSGDAENSGDTTNNETGNDKDNNTDETNNDATEDQSDDEGETNSSVEASNNESDSSADTEAQTEAVEDLNDDGGSIESKASTASNEYRIKSEIAVLSVFDYER